MSVKNQNSIVTDGLVFYVDAGNSNSYPGSGGTWSDLVGNNDGSFNNMDDINNPSNNYDSGNGGSIVFDGTNDVVESSINPSVFSTGYDAFTVNYWINWTDYADFNSTSFDLRFGNTVQWNDYIHNSSGNRLYSYPGGAVQISNTSFSLGVWYNICFAVTQGSGNTYKTYINGQLDKSGGWNKNLGTPSKYRIGGNNASKRFNGKIPLIGYYNRTLSSTEITQNYNALKNRFV